MGAPDQALEHILDCHAVPCYATIPVSQSVRPSPVQSSSIYMYIHVHITPRHPPSIPPSLPPKREESIDKTRQDKSSHVESRAPSLALQKNNIPSKSSGWVGGCPKYQCPTRQSITQSLILLIQPNQAIGIVVMTTSTLYIYNPPPCVRAVQTEQLWDRNLISRMHVCAFCVLHATDLDPAGDVDRQSFEKKNWKRHVHGLSLAPFFADRLSLRRPTIRSTLA